MKTIKLSKDYETIVDDDVYEWAKESKWHITFGNKNAKPYARRTKPSNRNKTEYLHRLIMNNPKGKLVDHENLNTLDNRRENLRECSFFENNRNNLGSKKRKCKYKGVVLQKGRTKFRSVITVDNKRINLGSFDTQEQAALAYNAAAIKYHGKFANLNKIV